MEESTYLKMVKKMKNKLSLKDVEWSEFQVSDIFAQIKRGKRLTKTNQKSGDMPYISSSALDNGVDNFISNDKNVRKFKKVLTIANSGSVGKVFYHPYTFVASDHVTSLGNKKASHYQYLFVATALEGIQEKYSFNREINNQRLKRERMVLPSKGNFPDWQFMEDYMKQMESELLKKEIEYFKSKIQEIPKVKPFDEVEWEEFFLTDIFTIKSGVRLTKADMTQGITPFVGATEFNNGITNFAGNKNNSLDKGVLGVNYNGSVVENFYHPYEALFTDDVKRLRLKEDHHNDKYIYLFIKQSILQQKNKYMYAYKFNAARMERQKILLPIKSNASPDWEYMKNYMKNIENKQIIAWLKMKGVEVCSE